MQETAFRKVILEASLIFPLEFPFFLTQGIKLGEKTLAGAAQSGRGIVQQALAQLLVGRQQVPDVVLEAEFRVQLGPEMRGEYERQKEEEIFHSGRSERTA